MSNIAPSAYLDLDSGDYFIGYAEVLARPFVDPLSGANPNPWVQIGDCDSFKISLNPTWAKRFAKNRSFSSLVRQDVTKMEGTVSFKAMQWSLLVRLYALLGQSFNIVQAAAQAQTFNVATINDGDIYFVGAYNISNVSVNLTDGHGTVTTAIPAGNVVVVDAALGGVQISGFSAANPTWVGAQAIITFDQSSCVKQAVRIGAQSRIDVDLMIRTVGNVGQKQMLHIWRAIVAPKGDQDYISSNDEYGGVEIEGALLQVSQADGVTAWGSWVPLDA